MKNTLRFLAPALFVYALGLVVQVAHAAEVVRSVSVFKETDQASKQVLTLKKGQSAKVTGSAVDSEGRSWLPVSSNGKTGWVEADALVLAEGDSGYVAPEPVQPYVAQVATPKLPRIRYWGGFGGTLVKTSDVTVRPDTFSGDTYGGAALGAGFDVLLGKSRRMPLGVRFLFPWINERSPGYGSGRISRFDFSPSFGYAFIPNTLELSAHLGFTYISGQSTEFDNKIATTPGLTLSWQLSEFDRDVMYQAVEFGAFKVEETRGNGGFDILSSICDAFSSTPDPTCTRGVAPAAYVFTLLYKIGKVH